MNERQTKFILCDSEDGPVCININQIAYFKNLYNNPDNNKVAIVMNAGINARVVVDGTVDGIIDVLTAATR